MMDSTRIPNGFLLPIQIHATHTANSRHANPRGETSHHVVTSVTREADNDMMTDLSAIEGIDLDDEVLCADPNHDHAVCGSGVPHESLRILEVLR